MKNYIQNIYSNNDISDAIEYMDDYKRLVNQYKQDMGIIGRFFAKIFGTTMYHDIEDKLYSKYGMDYYKALKILYEAHKADYVYSPFK